jgi:hypothetical protein
MSDSLYAKLKAQLSRLQWPSDFDTLHSYLTELQGSEYDIILLSQLFAKINKDIDSLITVEEFIESLVDAEEMIRRRLIEITAEIKGFKAEITKHLRLAEDSRKTEKFNAQGISTRSELQVDVQRLTLKGAFSDVYVVIECDREQRKTAVLAQDLTSNEHFQIPILEGRSNVKITVYQTPKVLLGEVLIPFSGLKSQVQSDEAFDLLNVRGDKVGSIKLKLLWIWNYALYYDRLAADWEQQLDQATTDNQHLSSQVLKLMLPFQPIAQSFPSSLEGSGNELDKAVLSLGSNSESQSVLDNLKFTDRSSLSSFSDANQVDESFARMSIDSGELPQLDNGELSFTDFKAHLDQMKFEKSDKGHDDRGAPEPYKVAVKPATLTRPRVASLHEKAGAKSQEQSAKDEVKAPRVARDDVKWSRTEMKSVQEAPIEVSTNLQEVGVSVVTSQDCPEGRPLPIALLLFVLVTGLLSSFARTDFLNVRAIQFTLATVLLLKPEFSLPQSAIVAWLVVSQVMDLLWLGFWSNEGEMLDRGVRAFVFWVTLGGFVGKCLLLKAVGS